MKRIFVYIVAVLFFSGCGGAGLTKLGIGDIQTCRVDKFGLGWAEGTLVVDVYNGNKKNVTFGSGRLELIQDDKTLAVATLQEAVDVELGLMRVELPVRIRFKMDGIDEILGLLLPKQGIKSDKKLRVKGSFDISRDGNERSVRFNRKLTDKMLESIGEQYVNLFDFN